MEEINLSANDRGLYERIKTYNIKVKHLFEELQKEDALSDDEATKRANYIVNEIKALAEENRASGKRLETNPEIFSPLYRGAADAYVLASAKVEPASRAIVASPANYWNMLADQTESIQMGIKIVKRDL